MSPRRPKVNVQDAAKARRLIAACTNAQLAAFGAPQGLTLRQVRERLLAAAATKPGWVIEALGREGVTA